MADNKSKLTIEDYKSDFTFKKKENGLNDAWSMLGNA